MGEGGGVAGRLRSSGLSGRGRDIPAAARTAKRHIDDSSVCGGRVMMGGGFCVLYPEGEDGELDRKALSDT